MVVCKTAVVDTVFYSNVFKIYHLHELDGCLPFNEIAIIIPRKTLGANLLPSFWKKLAQTTDNLITKCAQRVLDQIEY